VKAGLAGAALLVVLLAASGLTTMWGWAELNTPHKGWEGETIRVDIPRGEDARAVVDRLARAGVLRRPGLVRLWLRLRHDAGRRLQAGEYRFDRPATALSVLDRLARGDVLLHPVTLPEGLDLRQTAERIAGAGFVDREELVAAFHDPSPILDLDPEAEDLEGYLFPDTYWFPRDEPPERIAASLVRRFREVAGESYAPRAAEAGLTLREAVTLASLVEKETGRAEGRGRVSPVFHNRLDRGMRLQCDPTVLYAMAREGIHVDRLLSRHLSFNSPWNTYVVRGLPPGPIANPGLASLEAAIEPEDGDDLFFVAAPGGGHHFSKDLRSHQRAVRIWRDYVRSSR
jgi:UPF0755 protein